MKHIIIIGNGIAGVSTARHLRKQSDARITIISGETDHFFSRTALMYIYMGHMEYHHTKPYEDHFWKKNRIELLRAWVQEIDFEQKRLHLSDQGQLSYDQLVIASGSVPVQPPWKGMDAAGVQSLYSYQDLETMEANTKGIDKAIIVGGGLIGIEMAEMLHSRGIAVTFLIREESYWRNVLPQEESELISRHMVEHGVDLRTSQELKEILVDGGRASGVKLADGSSIEAPFVGVTVGVRPNVDWLKGTDLEINRGILINDKLETNLPDVYAVGDCAEVKDPREGRRALEPVWYTGRMMGEALGQRLGGKEAYYHPGVWFNSAKFFDIEYQTYGFVPPDWDKATTSSFYWEEASGKIGLRLNFEKNTDRLLGVNALGLRLRHELFDQWIKEGISIEKCINQLSETFFDPEFFKNHKVSIQKAFVKQFPNYTVNMIKKSWWSFF